jgi:Animal haem peroxidase
MPKPAGYRSGPLWTAYDRLAEKLDRWLGWDRLPKPLGLFVLFGLRNQLRQRNLADTGLLPRKPGEPLLAPVPLPPAVRRWRTADGSFNDLGDPRAGMAGARFGRNIPLDAIAPVTPESLRTPDPRRVSTMLLGRPPGGFQPAETLNLLAAAWIQFMVKDWFSHGIGDMRRPLRLPFEAGDSWPEPEVVIPLTLADPTRPGAPDVAPPTFVNVDTHWWDLSSIYGSTQAEQHARRSHEQGRLLVTPQGGLPLPDADPASDPTRIPGFWLGLAMLGTLFVLEHNAICDALHAAYPDLDDEALFQQARLVNAAVTAKIHTVEWTPAIIAHPTTATGMRASWYGLAGERLAGALRGVLRNDLLIGIPGSHAQQFGVPFSLTEEFAAVYRMHPLIPDEYRIRSHADDALLAQHTFREVAGPATRAVLEAQSMTDLFYSFGSEYPGALSLRNYPRFLQEFRRPDTGAYNDIAATDIVRMREAGVPRYNAFRRLMRMRPVAEFAELSDDPELVAAMRELYGDVEQVDLMVGMFAERKPRGFGFSDTAFRIFLLMAGRRLNSDRFFTDDFTEETYTALGLHWVENATMGRVLVRHCPGLRALLAAQPNAFQPWGRA